MGPGPSTVPARVLQAMSAPTLGHLDPAYLAIMDETRRLMRQVMATENELTMAISGTGSAGMEACVCNLVEPGDEMLVGVNGVFGGRMRDVAERYGAQVHAIEAPWGKSIDPAEVIRNRKTKVTSWYLDASMLMNYWGSDRVYHHTAPINMTYALREALLMVVEEGLEQRYARHMLNHRALRAGLESMHLNYLPDRSLPTLNAVAVPEGVDDAKVRGRLLNEFGIEIGAGLGPFKGKAWRIGLMGHGSTQRNVILILSALGSLLRDQGIEVSVDEALAAANQIFRAGESNS